MPIRWAVRITRQAISPRFAMSRVFNIWRVVRSKPLGLGIRFHGIALFLDSAPSRLPHYSFGNKIVRRKNCAPPLHQHLLADTADTPDGDGARRVQGSARRKANFSLGISKGASAARRNSALTVAWVVSTSAAAMTSGLVVGFAVSQLAISASWASAI